MFRVTKNNKLITSKEQVTIGEVLWVLRGSILCSYIHSTELSGYFNDFLYFKMFTSWCHYFIAKNNIKH